MSSKVSIAGVDTTKLPKLSNNDILALIKKVKNGDGGFHVRSGPAVRRRTG